MSNVSKSSIDKRHPDRALDLDGACHEARLEVFELVISKINELKDASNVSHQHSTDARNSEDIEEIKRKIDSISSIIMETKQELASLNKTRANAFEANPNNVNNELTAIVSDTENATHAILDAAEALASIAENDSLDIESLKKSVSEKAMDIIIACGFQDITGQRIKRIVETISSIDDEIELLSKTFHHDPEDMSRAAQIEAGLLNGPAMKGQEAVDQEAIDKLFD